MSAPSSSLLIPCYKAAGFLPRLWETIRAQTKPFDEIICYDDASPDRTADVARELGATVIAGRENRGPAHARNQLWRAARGTWVHFHDADDLLDPAYHAKVSARADAATDVVLCNALWLHEDTRAVEIEWQYSDAELRAEPVPYLLRRPVGGINGYYRRAILEAVGGFDERLKTWEDADLHVRLAAAGARFAVVEESLVIALRHAAGASRADAGERMLESRTALLESYLRQLDPAHRAAVAHEAEKLAGWLLHNNSRPDLADRCLALCRAAGWAVPSSGNRWVRLARTVLPGRWLLRQQQRARNPSAS